jgi:tripartite-type tricarboxylate transporter receptor subunit TctC
MRRRQLVQLTAATLAAPSLSVFAQAFPARPIKLLIAFPAGGPTDIMGRTAAKAIGDVLGQSFVVENKTGAGGNIGTDAVAKAAADGYTIGLSAISSLAISPHLQDKLPFQVDKDFAPISLVGTTPCMIVVHPSAPFSDLKGLVAYAKANPGKLAYATSGIGTSNHLAAEVLQSVAGIELNHIPYRGSSQIVPDLLSGTVTMSMESSLATTLPHIRAGKLKALAVTSPARAAALPNVPTVAESGYPGFAVETWFGLVAPAATPALIVQKLNEAWAKGAKPAEARAAFDIMSATLRVTTPQEFGAFIKAENTRWGALIRKLNIKAD